jgi:hypothetical protein
LDAVVYAIFCSHMLDHYKMTEAQWNRLDNDLRPDLFGLPFGPVLGAMAPVAYTAATPEAEHQPAAGLVSAAQIQVRDPQPTAQPAATQPQAAQQAAQPQSAQPAAAPAKKPKPKRQSNFASSDWMSRL